MVPHLSLLSHVDVVDLLCKNLCYFLYELYFIDVWSFTYVNMYMYMYVIQCTYMYRKQYALQNANFKQCNSPSSMYLGLTIVSLNASAA